MLLAALCQFCKLRSHSVVNLSSNWYSLSKTIKLIFSLCQLLSCKYFHNYYQHWVTKCRYLGKDVHPAHHWESHNIRVLSRKLSKVSPSTKILGCESGLVNNGQSHLLYQVWSANFIEIWLVEIQILLPWRTHFPQIIQPLIYQWITVQAESILSFE